MRHYVSISIVGIVLAAVLSFSTAVHAQGRLCAKRDDVIMQLKSVHGEVRQSVGLQRNSRVMEIFANEETGAWTIIVSMPTGLACLVAAGEAYSKDPFINQDDPA